MKVRKGLLGRIGRVKAVVFIVLGSLYLVAALIGWLELMPFGYDPNDVFYQRWGVLQYAAPSWQHPMGTDGNGRDVAIRLIYGAKISLSSGVVATVFFLISGLALGVLTGYFEGRWRKVFLYLFSLVNSFPILLLLMLTIVFFEFWLRNLPAHVSDLKILFLMVFLGIFSGPRLAELIRRRIISLKEQEFVLSVKSLGVGPFVIIFKHIVWYECRLLLLIQGADMMGRAVLFETILTYLNYGVQTPKVSWGLMLRNMIAGVLAGKISTIFPMIAVASLVAFFMYISQEIGRLYRLRTEQI